MIAVVPEFRETAKANFLAIAEGGLSEEYLFLACYADYVPSEYVLGAGPSSPNTITLAYDRMEEAHSYALYRVEHDAGMFGDEALMSKGEYQGHLDGMVREAEAELRGIVGDRESVVMLAPMGAHNAIAVEAWQAVAQWDLQEDDQSVVHAVRYGVPSGDPEHTQTLTNLKSRITAAATTDAFADDRIANVSGLTQYYRDIGAYGDITPDDGSAATFTPAAPPVAYSCASGSAVTNPGDNLGLVHDCEALVDGKDTLRGTGSLNWATGTAISSWDGVTTAGTPTRVTKVDLDDESLTGSIPAELGSLSELTHLDLSDNSLTGDIPTELGLLHNLQEIRLSGNSLTGCIPIALRDVATNDLSSLSLPYCRPPAPGAPTAGTAAETSVPLTWTAAANTSKYRVEYREGDFGYWTVSDDTIATTSHSVDELQCATDYQFRLSAYGSGTGFGAAWSDPSASLAASTGPCVPPVFGATSYSFNVMGDASVDDLVGTVSATDDSGKPVTYAITAGNEDDHFTIDEETGSIAVAADLTGEAGTTVTLMVEARDEAGGAATVTVTVWITETCDSGTAVPNPGSNPDLVSDCRTLLGLQSALSGTATLNWSAELSMSSWDGITLRGTPQRVTRLSLEREGLTGSIPAAIGDLAGLESLRLRHNSLMGNIPATLGQLTELDTLQLNSNDLTGPIPTELGSLTNLEAIYLYDNDLTGAIPSELGNLTEVYDLWLQDNDLTGSIPPELGSMTELGRLWLADNDLSGTIPAELTNLSNLSLLVLYGNNLEGCVPPSLRDVGFHDLDDLGLSDCQEGPPVPGNLAAALTDLTFTLTWDAVTGADKYEVQYTTDAADAQTVTWTALDEVTAATQDFDGDCDATYRFRVRAHGDGYTYPTHWGTESAATEAASTRACNLPPVFAGTPYSFTVAENAVVGASVGTVTANDPDQNTVTYAITAGNTGNVFTIGNGTGEITVAAALDHEAEEEYTLTVTADDGDAASATPSETVTITVGDVGEAPAFDAATTGPFEVAEDAATGASVGTVTANDPEEDTLTYAITAGNIGNAFTIGDGTGQIAVAAALDHETAGSYTLTVTADDGDATTTTPSVSVTVTVGDVGEPPVFDTTTTGPFEVAENATTGDTVGTVTANDPEEDTLTYAITAGNIGNAFTIGDGTGEITVAAGLDHEITEEYTLTVTADDGDATTSTPSVSVTVTVTDVAENPPPAPENLGVTLADGTFTLTWDAVTGVAKYEAQHTTDAADAATVTWTALPEVTTATAAYSPTDGPPCSTEYRFRVRAYGDGDAYTEMWGTESDVEVLATNGCPEFTRDPYEFEVDEDAGTGDSVGTVEATDPEIDDVTYAITAGNTGRVFTIDDETGQITVTAALDHEATEEYSLTVEAEDEHGGTDTAIVNVTVGDVGEAPAFDAATTGPFEVAEDAATGAPVGTVTANDPEEDPLTYAITAGNVGNAFTIGDGTGEITVAAALDHETTGSYTLTVTTDDGDGTTTTPSVSVTVTVSDVGEAPVFDTTTTGPFEVAENATTGGAVGTVTANDPEEDTLTYAITAGNIGNAFTIGDRTGEITVAAGLDHEAIPSYTLTVTADDGDATTTTPSVSVTVTVTNVAEDPPPAPTGLAVVLAEGAFSVTWSPVTGADRYEAQYTTDGDADTATWIALPAVGGTSQFYAPTDGPTCSTTYRFRVRAYGDGDTYTMMWGTESGVESVATATCDPEFARAAYDFFIRDTAATDSAVGSVSATDPDTDDAVTYTITGGNDAGKFAIGEETGEITVAGTDAFNLAQTPYYTLTIEASDGDGGTDTARVRVALTLAECATVRVVPQYRDHPGLVRDCSVLLTAKDTLRGTATLNWSSDTSIFDWEGVRRRGGTGPQYVGTLYLPDLGLNGTIPAVLAGLADLRRLDLDGNELTGSIPPELGSLEDLEQLYLFGNDLTGSIPTTFGNLGSLQILSLYDNDLSGSIPPELGKLKRLQELLLDGNDLTGSIPSELANLTQLRNFYARDNGLTGSIPAWLADLPHLTYLYLDGNNFTGCIPQGLRDIDYNDMDRISLADCTT